MSYADLPPNACYVPEMHLEPYWLVKYGDHNLIMTDAEFWEFADHVKHDGVGYTAARIERAAEYVEALPEARL